MDEIKVIQGKLSRAYESVQNLNMQPTKTNMEILLATMAALKDAYDFLSTLEPPEEEREEVKPDAIDNETADAEKDEPLEIDRPEE